MSSDLLFTYKISHTFTRHRGPLFFLFEGQIWPAGYEFDTPAPVPLFSNVQRRVASSEDFQISRFYDFTYDDYRIVYATWDTTVYRHRYIKFLSFTNTFTDHYKNGNMNRLVFTNRYL